MLVVQQLDREHQKLEALVVASRIGAAKLWAVRPGCQRHRERTGGPGRAAPCDSALFSAISLPTFQPGSASSVLQW